MKTHAYFPGGVCLFFLLAILFSCRSSREMMYLRDVKGQKQVLNGLPANPPLYRLKPKDNLFISIISSNPDLNRIYNPYQVSTNTTVSNQFENLAGQYVHGYEIDSEGNVTLPVIGKVKLAGKTLPESQMLLESKAETYLKQATVKVRLLNFKVTVLGEVKNPGVYYSYGYNCSELDAMGMANGCTDFASLENVMVLRPVSNGSMSYTLNFNNKDALNSEAFYLQPNDVVFVQPGRNKFLQPRLSGITIALGAVSSTLLLLNYLK